MLSHHSGTLFAGMRVAVAQVCASADAAANRVVFERLAATAAEKGASLACFPECALFLGSNTRETVAHGEEQGGETEEFIAALARTQGIAISVAGVQEAVPGDSSRIYNTHLLFDSAGKLQGRYRKCHLFDVDLSDSGGPRLLESGYTRAGDCILPPICIDGVSIGLTTCYDLRFPEVFSRLRRQGADVLLVPSAFTVPTGKAHWEVLLRARAIETQCYVIASAQAGRHNERRESYGHSLAVDPWGTVLVDLQDEVGTVAVVDLDPELLASVRRRLPVFSHRRESIYSAAGKEKEKEEEEEEEESSST